MGRVANVIFFVLLLALSLNAFDAKVYEKKIATYPAYKVKKDYNSLKSKYIKAIINDNKKEQLEILQGLVICAKRLNLYSAHYEKEIGALRKELKINPPSKNVVKNKKTPTKKSSTKKPKVISYPYISKVRYSNGKLILSFSKKIDKSYIRQFNINKRSYKTIFDIKANLRARGKNFKISGYKRVVVSQNRKNLVRIVLESTKKIKANYKIYKNILSIDLKNLKTVKKKSVAVKKSPKKTKKETTKKHKKRYDSAFYASTKIIVIDPGHGGKDSGAIGRIGKKRYKEKVAVLSIGKKLYTALKKQGYRVYMTRNRDKFIKLRNRTKYANKKRADIFISIHANAAPNKRKYKSMQGIETFFLSPARSNRSKRVAELENRIDIKEMDYFSKQTFLNFLNREKIIASNKLAIDIQRSILAKIRRRYKVVDGGVREAPFWVLVGAQMPSVLVEVGYITHPVEGKRLFNKRYQQYIVEGIVNGINNYFLKNR